MAVETITSALASVGNMETAKVGTENKSVAVAGVQPQTNDRQIG
jgi:hypothetical protein